VLEDFPEGWFVPIQRSLTKPGLVGGVPFGFAVLNGTWTMALALGAQKLWVVPVGLAAYAVAALACKVDPYFFDVLKEHFHTEGYYGV
jgi:type IV secretion system protein TrbD